MTEDFKKWLDKHATTKKEYESHPEFREEIFRDYQLETAFEDFDSWLNWALKNEETARRHFPHIMDDVLTKAVLGFSDFKHAQVVQVIADFQPKWRKESEDLIGPAKRKFIKNMISILETILLKESRTTPVVSGTIESFKDEFVSSLEYWNGELEKLGPNDKATVQSKSEVEQRIRKYFEDDNEKGWQKYFDREKDFNYVVELLRLNIEGLPYELPKTPIPTKKRTKTNLGNLLGTIHYLSPNEITKKDRNYIELVKCISPFDKEKNVYKYLTRDREE